MKLIDLLVQELPKRGGWPHGADYAVQDSDGSCDIKFGAGDESELEYENRGVWVNDQTPDWGIDSPESYIRDLHPLAIDAATAIITRDQYEAALAAAQQPVWNGEGLPPIGCEFEFGTHRTRAKCLGIGHHMIFASKGDPDDEDGDFEEFMISIMHSEFHPIRTEAERKRQEAITKITDAICGDIPDTGMATAAKYAARAYDAIAAGKIPGIKLEVTP